jgi:cytochrome c-type biogenesis protein CcmE
MNRKQKTRLIGSACLVIILGTAVALILYALKQNINLFYTPTQLLQTHTTPGQHLRIGGYVKKHSVNYDKSGQSVHFIVTDRIHEMKISYQGVLPNLFREGQAVVITGTLTPEHTFLANEVLAKHDERYMPPQLAKQLKAQGRV